MSDEQEILRAREAIEGITAELKGPMSNLERALLVAGRTDWRERLAKLLAAQPA